MAVKTERERVREKERQTCRQTDRLTERQTDRQIDSHCLTEWRFVQRGHLQGGWSVDTGVSQWNQSCYRQRCAISEVRHQKGSPSQIWHAWNWFELGFMVKKGQGRVYNRQWKKRSETQTLYVAVVRQSQNFSPYRRPPSRGRSMAKI